MYRCNIFIFLGQKFFDTLIKYSFKMLMQLFNTFYVYNAELNPTEEENLFLIWVQYVTHSSFKKFT